MACQFSIPFTGSSGEVLARAQQALRSQGGTLAGNDAGGSFQLNVMGSAIEGNYAVQGNQLMIVINTKPFLIPCSTIEGFLRDRLR